jgi:hypothetical protein
MTGEERRCKLIHTYILPREDGARALCLSSCTSTVCFTLPISLCLNSDLQMHSAQFHDYTASNPQLRERARRDLRDCDQNDTNCVKLPVCVPMTDKLFETPASIGKEPYISDPQLGRI